MDKEYLEIKKMTKRKKITFLDDLEEIPLLLVYKKNGLIETKASDEIYSYELYGFLKCLVMNMEEELREDIVPKE